MSLFSLILYHPSSCPAGHLGPFRNAFYSSRSIADAVRAPHDGHPMAFTYSLFTPFLGSSWPARSSFAFWCPGYCSSGDVIATSPQDMSDQSPSPYPLFGLDRNALYLSHTFPVKSTQFSHVCSRESPHLCPVCLAYLTLRRGRWVLQYLLSHSH